MTAPAGDTDEARRARRRAFVRVAHPDAGGDPDAFVRGLAAFDAPGGHPSPRSPVVVVRSRRPDRTAARLLRTARRRLHGQPARHLL